MGAGAGCTIEISNSRVNDVDPISLEGATLDVGKWSASITLNCKIYIEGSIEVSSYNYSSGEVEEVSMTVDNVTLNLGIGDGNNGEILTADAIDRFEEQFDGDIESIWEDFLPILTVDDIDPLYIRDVLLHDRNNSFDGSGKFGGGWIGVTFAGAFDIDEVDEKSGYNSISGYSAHVNEDFVIDYLDKAKYGDNIEYTAFYNGDILDTYNELDEAINALKAEILADLGAVDPEECYVESNYYYLRNGSVGNYEYESDWDYSEVEYCADSDPDFDFETLSDISNEIDEENDVGIGEDFDI